jgi:signal transduction histidine kinase
VQGLRDSGSDINDLAESIRTLGEALGFEHGDARLAALRVEVVGETRTLRPMLRDEVFRIASEALRNALRHAQAKQVDVEIRYENRHFRLRVRDDGKGILPEALAHGGIPGHFGLRGMRERAKLAGGTLTVWSAPEAGTEVELVIPARHAYASTPSMMHALFSERLYNGS